MNFGAKKGGGYYAYVASKFSNDLIVARSRSERRRQRRRRAASSAASCSPSARTRPRRPMTTVTANAGMGGQGVLPIPLVYNGWVQKLPQPWKNQLTPKQLNPIK